MPVHLWIALGLAITLISLLTILLIATRRSRPAAARSVTAVELLVWLAFLALAAFLRFGHVEALHGGALTIDEAQATRSYVSSIVHFERTEYGGTYLVHAWLLDTWYGLFGFGTFSPRYYAATAGLVGLVFFFAALRLLLGVRAAAWATIFLGLSTHAVYFSVFAVEMSSLMLAVPVNSFLFVLWWRRPTPLRSCALGLGLGLGAFTYPGVLLGYAAVLVGWALCWTVDRTRKTGNIETALGNVSGRAWLAAAASLGSVLLIGVALHERVYSQAHPLFHGGGSFSGSWAAFKSGLPVVLGDVFVRAATWNLPFGHAPFVEWTYWPWALLGAYAVWTRYARWAPRGVVLSIATVVLLVPLTGAYPGMRRGLYILFPVCALAGVGVDELDARAGRWLASVLAVVAVAHPFAYQATIGWQQWCRSGFGQSYSADPVPDALMLQALEKHNVIMSADEFAHPWDRLRHLHYWKLALRHGALRHPEHTLHLVNAADPKRVAALAAQPEPALLTWKPEVVLAAIARPAGLCFRLAGLEQRPALVSLVPPALAIGDVCPWPEGRDASLTSCARLGSGHRLSRLVHDVVCENAHCESSRADFVYVEPGSVTFRLRPPARRAGVVHLVLGVVPPVPPARANRVWVNDRDIGVVTGPETGGRVSIEVGPEAWVEADGWSVRLGPAGEKGRSGWDVVWAALQARGISAAAADDPCPQKLCVTHARGEVCEDARTHHLIFRGPR